MLKGSETLAMALSGIGPTIYSVRGSPLSRIERLLLRGGGETGRLASALSDGVAAGLALSGALLSQHPTCALLGQEGLLRALPVLAGAGLLSELRSGAVLIEPVAGRDSRAAVSQLCPLPILEAGTAEDLFHLCSLAFLLSESSGGPVVLRVPQRALSERAAIRPGPETARGGMPGAIAADDSPYLYGALPYHLRRRQLLLQRLQPHLGLLLSRTPGSGRRGVVLAGHLGRRTQARAAGRGLHTLRLGASHPLPEGPLREFLAAAGEVLVLEEGEPFLLPQLQALARQLGPQVQVSGPAGVEPGPVYYDEARLDQVLTAFAGPPRGDGTVPGYDHAGARRPPSLRPQLDERGEADEEPWPLHVARLRRDLPAAAGPRGALQELLLRLSERVLPCAAALPAFSADGEPLLFLQPPRGAVAALAGGLCGAVLSEGPALPVAILEEGEYAGEHLGVLDNLLAGRDVLHILLMHRPGHESGPPAFPEQHLAGMEVARAELEDTEGLTRALSYLLPRRGPRLLLCTEEAPPAASQISV